MYLEPLIRTLRNKDNLQIEDIPNAPIGYFIGKLASLLTRDNRACPNVSFIEELSVHYLQCTTPLFLQCTLIKLLHVDPSCIYLHISYSEVEFRQFKI